MIKEDILKVQTCVLKVNMHCPGCEKQVKKIIQKIDGVFQSSVDRNQGKVTVSGLMDPYTVIKKLNKAHKRAQLWGPNPEVASQGQKLQLGNGGKGQPKGGEVAASGSGGGGGDGGEDAEMVMPPPPLPPQQQPQQLQREMQMKGVKLPPQLMGMGGKMPMPAAAPPARAKAVKFDVPEGEEPGDDDSDSDDVFDDGDFEDDGLGDDDGNDDDDAKMVMKPMAMPPAAGGSGNGGTSGGRDSKIPVQIKGNANIGDTIAELIRAKQKENQGGASGGGKNGGGAQAPQNGNGSAPGGGNQLPGQANKGVAAGGPPAGVVRGPMMMGGMPPPPPQPGMMMNMMGGAGFPGMGQSQTAGGRPRGGMPMGHPQNGGVGMQAAGGGSAAVHGMTAGGMMPGAGLYPGRAGGAGVGGGMAPAPDQMMHAAWNNPVAQQQPHMMVDGDGNHVHGGASYPPMGYGYRYGLPPMPYNPPPSYYQPPHPRDNMFSDENPNSCSVM